jgi:hypothetical protein
MGKHRRLLKGPMYLTTRRSLIPFADVDSTGRAASVAALG